ncbi:MAG: cytochrome c biogenesis protein ResB, partial [Clostridia bacterium]|nr:cytochrome c biogenesis protein ResB [Clostridia bacterium]
MTKIWHFLRSMRFGMTLLVLILLCSLAGSFIPQGNAPAWYEQAYPGWHGPLLALGLHDIFRSWYFIALTALLCLNLTLCSLLRIVRVTKAARGAVRAASGRTPNVPLTPEGAKMLRAYLAARHYRKTEFGDTTVYSKNRVGWYGSFLTHLAILLTVLLGAASIYLPVATDETCMPGDAIAMADGTTIHVDDFHIENEAGELDYASTIRVTLPDGRAGGPARVSVNHPYSFGRYKIYQQTYGTAGAVHVRNTATGGEDRFTLDSMCFLSLDGANGVWFEALYPGYLRDEEGNFTLITQTAGVYEDPVYQILLSVDGTHTPVLAFPGETVTVAGVEYTFEDPVEYPGLRIKKTP